MFKSRQFSMLYLVVVQSRQRSNKLYFVLFRETDTFSGKYPGIQWMMDSSNMKNLMFFHIRNPNRPLRKCWIKTNSKKYNPDLDDHAFCLDLAVEYSIISSIVVGDGFSEILSRSPSIFIVCS